MTEKYINLNFLSKEDLKKFWDFVFKKATSVSFRFPNVEHSTSNMLKLKYNDKAEISETFVNYLERNKELIIESSNHLIKKEISNIYLDDKYKNLSEIYICEMFSYLKDMVYKKPNLYEWLEPELPEDLSFYINKKRFLYTCSHEELSIMYLEKDDINELSKLIPSLF